VITNNYILPINLVYFTPCVSTLFRKPSAMASASMLVDPSFQFKKQTCAEASTFLLYALSQTTQYLFRISTNNTFLVLKPIILA